MEPVKPQMGLLWLHGEASLASRWSQPDSVTGLTMEPDKNAGLVCGSMIEPPWPHNGASLASSLAPWWSQRNQLIGFQPQRL